MPTTNLTSQQKRVYDWLHEERDLPVFAEAYVAAVHLLNVKTPGYITLVAHVGRDFANVLARTVSGTDGGRVQYVQLTESIKSEWKDEWRGRGITSSEGGFGEGDHSEGHLVTYEACAKVRELLEEHEAGTERSNLANDLVFSTFLDYDDIDRIPKNLVDEWKIARRWFLAHAHCREGCFSVDEQREIEQHFQTLHSMLYVAASSAYERLKGIDDILEETNKRDGRERPRVGKE
ncbi:MAG: hypothetical protein OXM03_10530 [Chloroflexota bacterium]|nr:hypothetical protein [Chloroflexota bacterium]MDE2841051.1 hypothetical protein [Chloroflexota bacterium]MDE2929410.1 hypothetical protein [Chloroflexota bacterium]